MRTSTNGGSAIAHECGCQAKENNQFIYLFLVLLHLNCETVAEMISLIEFHAKCKRNQHYCERD